MPSAPITFENVGAAVRFISAEPLLGPVTLDLSGIHWPIAGGESGPRTSPEPSFACRLAFCSANRTWSASTNHAGARDRRAHLLPSAG